MHQSWLLAHRPNARLLTLQRTINTRECSIVNRGGRLHPFFAARISIAPRLMLTARWSRAELLVVTTCVHSATSTAVQHNQLAGSVLLTGCSSGHTFVLLIYTVNYSASEHGSLNVRVAKHSPPLKDRRTPVLTLTRTYTVTMVSHTLLTAASRGQRFRLRLCSPDRGRRRQPHRPPSVSTLHHPPRLIPASTRPVAPQSRRQPRPRSAVLPRRLPPLPPSCRSRLLAT